MGPALVWLCDIVTGCSATSEHCILLPASCISGGREVSEAFLRKVGAEGAGGNVGTGTMDPQGTEQEDKGEAEPRKANIPHTPERQLSIISPKVFPVTDSASTDAWGLE
jgi:hypothetical protein